MLHLLVQAGVERDPRPGDRDRARDAAELRRQQALVVPRARPSCRPGGGGARGRGARRAGTRARAQAAVTADGRHGGDDGRGRQGRVRPGHGRRRADRERGSWRASSPIPKVRRLARPLSAATDDRRRRSTRPRASGGCTSGRARRERSRRAGSRTRAASVLEAWTGPQVAWKMARGRAGRLRRQDPERLVGVAPLQPRLPPRARRPAAAALLAHRRPARARSPSASRSGSSTAGEIFRSAPARRTTARSTCSSACRGSGFGGRRRSAAGGTWPVWLLAAVAVFLAGFRVGLNVEAPAQRDRRRLRRRDRRGPHPRRADAVRAHAGSGAASTPCGRADADGEIRDRIQANGRCESANPRGDTYGPVAYLAYVPAVLTFGWSGKWDALPAAHATAILLRPARRARPRPRRPAARRQPTGGDARVRLARLSVQRLRAGDERERRDHARPARLGLLARHLGTGRAGRSPRWPAGRSSRRCSSRPSGSRIRPACGVPRRSASARAFAAATARCVLDPAARAGAARRGAHLLGADARLPARPRVAVLHLGLGAVPRPRHTRPGDRPAGAAGGRARARRRRRRRAAAQGAARARRAHCRDPDRVRARR